MTGVSRVKRRTLQVMRWVDSILPRSVAVWTRNRCWPWRPVLDVVEVHLADTCNLNCKGCLHFSPFSKPCLAKVEEVERDFAALKTKFAAVRHVHLLGGEPLLNPDVVRFLKMTRQAWPKTRLSLVTNGLLLLAQDAAFWTACRETRAMIDMTWYPVMTEKTLADIREKCRAEQVVLRVSTIREFMDKIRLEGREDAARSFKACQKMVYCPYLREGRLYPCATSYHLRDRLPNALQEPGIDIRTSTAREILTYLATPVNACRYCAEKPTEMKWGRFESLRV